VVEEARRRPHIPPRSRREFEAQQDAASAATQPSELDAPLWTARGRRLAQEAAEAAARAAREAEAEAQRRAEEERRRAEEAEAARIEAGMRRMRRYSRHAPADESEPADDSPRSSTEDAYDVASTAVGEGSAIEIEDIGAGSSDAGQEVWAGQGEDDRADD
jgi:colicin import membrane protein